MTGIRKRNRTHAAPRRYYLRVTAEPNAGLARRVDSLIRRIGLTVQNRAARGAGQAQHLGFLVSSATAAEIAEVEVAVRRLGRVQELLVMGVSE